ncbi:MAG: PEP-CTERM system histidine kinase PrsK, partial [Gammaproteobacteria bacterium]|nr:PEP-CTERM system histidine kinase PrsK [Gammaproteobacteria bacterium]
YLLMTYSLLTVLWAQSNSQTQFEPFSDRYSFMVENMPKMVLFFFLLAALSKTDLTLRELLGLKKSKLIVLLFSFWLVLGSSGLITTQLQLISALLLTIILMALVEAIYRQSELQKWQFKPLIIALGIVLLFDFYLQAEAALLGKINHQTWQARGYIHVLMLPFLVVAVKRIKSWGINVYVSRDVVLQSSLVLASGVYLCILALVGYYLSYFGGDWTTLIQVVFVVGGCSVLSVLLFSDAIRRKYKVFIEKHFFANTFDYREKWIALSKELKQVEIADQNAPTVCIKAWCQAIGYSKGALVRFHQITKPEVLATTDSYRLTETDLDLTMLYQQQFSQKNWLLDFDDTSDIHVKHFRLQLATTAPSFSLLVPIQKNAQLWGCCLLTPEPNERLKLNWELRDYLNAVSEQISSYLFMSEASKTLSENAQFIAFSRMSAFVVHDLKNVKAQIDMLLKNAKRHRHNPEFVDDAFETIEAMQSRLQNMLSQLTQKQIGNEPKKNIALGNMLQQLISERCAGHAPLPVLKVLQDCELYIDHERFSNILFHLIDNAQQATAIDGSVTIELDVINDTIILAIIDTGCGMSSEFIKERLFKPFDTTKGNAGMGIGAYDAQQFIQQNHGQLTVTSEVDIGSTFTIQLPLH